MDTNDMHEHDSLVNLIESAGNRSSLCAICRDRTIVVEHDGALWLECVRHDTPAVSLLDRLQGLLGHDRELLLTSDEMAA